MTQSVDANEVIRKLQSKIGEQVTTIVLLEIQLEQLQQQATAVEQQPAGQPSNGTRKSSSSAAV